MTAVIEAEGLSVAYPGGERAIETVDIAVERGQTVLVVGSSGCGKSTLLKAVSGLVPHLTPADVTGYLRVAGIEVADSDLATIGRKVSSVLQNPRTQFFCVDPVSELAFASENFGRPPDLIRERIGSAVLALGIGELLGSSMHAMSGGQKQRVAIGAAFVNDPEVYVLDEPTSSLDRESISTVREMIATLRMRGATILIAEHRLAYLEGLVDRVVLLDAGHLVDRWSGPEFFAMPAPRRMGLGLRRLTAASSGTLPVAEGGEDGVWLHDLSYSYRRGIPALRLREAHLPRGRVTVVSGPNGAGKTTLVKVICGLLEPQGSITLDGHRMGAASRRRHCFLVMQDVNRQLFADSVADEVALGGDITRAQAAMRSLGLDVLAERHPLSLSGGQQQRTVIAAGLAQRRDVYVFDEPSSGLDFAAMTRVAALLRELAATGVVVVVVTHDDELASTCGDVELRVVPAGR
ncbi:energy-coupling factor transport system ATP-binding protein [Propionibacterium cyclohexanicum]|uniref:Energy-coupling factor transport system ATP-binding protein n=1 Tax=Propionibacterium cyclohexanicum TaxID=64702 RepID=A0A1H9RS93_9ACTN|nr:ABC transporter ATP-binding protein [Propionibacterium cyclohexanicum]SER75672.1 energy-coupling factor transport system ATP-binding protein [Propionibacterium cyclohexanicum]